MACKFHAAMRNRTPLDHCPPVPRRLLLRHRRCSAGGALALAVSPAQAEKADRFKPLDVEADQPGRIDLLNQVFIFNGNVVVTKGTMIDPGAAHRGARVARRLPHARSPSARRRSTRPSGRSATRPTSTSRATPSGSSTTASPTSSASSTTPRCGGCAAARPADEISGNLVTYDSTTEVFNVTGGAPATAANPAAGSGRC